MKKKKSFEDVHDSQLKLEHENFTSISQDLKSPQPSQEMELMTYWETLIHYVKGNVGCGILGIGMAFKNGGIIFSIVTIIAVTILSFFNQRIMISMAEQFKSTHNLESITYAETIGMAFDAGSPIFKKYSSFMRKAVTYCMLVTQLGICSVYLLFISQSLDQVLNCYGLEINKRILIITTFPIIWITSLIKQIKYIVPLSLLANLSILVALALILHASVSDLPSITERKLLGNWNQIPLSIGSIIFSMEGICVTLPLQQNMKKREQFIQTCGVLNVALLFIFVLVTTIGIFGYWKFGENVKDSLSLNLELQNNILSQTVIICVMIGILCTYTLQLFVPVVLLLPKIKNRPVTLINNEYALRTSLVLFTFFIAEVIPRFDLFSSLIGAIGGTFLAFMLCPLADIAMRKKEDRGKFNWKLISIVILFLIGVAAFVIGTSVTMTEIVINVMNDLNIN